MGYEIGKDSALHAWSWYPQTIVVRKHAHAYAISGRRCLDESF